MRYPLLLCGLAAAPTHLHAALIEPDYGVCLVDLAIPWEDCPDELIRALGDWRISLRVDDILVLVCAHEPWPPGFLEALDDAGYAADFGRTLQEVRALQVRARRVNHCQERARLAGFLAVYHDATEEELTRKWALRCAPTLMEREEIAFGRTPFV